MDFVKITTTAPTDISGLNTALSNLNASLKIDESKIEVIFNEFNRYKKMLGLSSINSKAEVFAKHFYESVLLALVLEDKYCECLYACDLGTGNGFPGLVLVSIFSNWKFSLFESSVNRSAYLESTLAAMKVNNAAIENIYLTTAPDGLRSKFDIVTHRAFASLEYTHKLAHALGTESHITAGFISEPPKNNGGLLFGYRVDKLLEYRNYKNKAQYIYTAHYDQSKS
jgi:16S rRNA G527 N7-methylase RsmG